MKEIDADMIESIEMWLHEIEPKWVEKELNWLEELRSRLLESETPNDLEEAAEAFAFKSLDEVILYGCTLSGRRACFIAGAKWQEEKDTRDMYMSDNRHFEKVYQLGRTDMREKMMKEAVEGWVARDKNGRITLYEDKPYRDGDIWRGCSWKSSLIYDRFFPNLKWEDEPIKVRLIILKEDAK